ncbi:hypothetical protein PYCCODRAFT_1508703 [Trametes coccinea BRFM310]|uniref:Uncharacterized protein n=1 Tax=Trametes coccinea (strain BRFM310) TaxID=1353009 RepID=A0A1Y2ILU7_TRAC3|nr:hypothetical protein PYCCODRAFT_1508703 [Trametes coccinea BRFM310]
MFTQDWAPKVSALPEDLRAMISAARKYGLRQEGLAFERSILDAMTMWSHGMAEQEDLRKLSTESAVTRCIRLNHKASTVGEFRTLAERAKHVSHRRHRECTCPECEEMIVSQRCANPDRCYTRAEAILDTLPPKWDPRGKHPEDYEEGGGGKDARRRGGLGDF